MASEHPGREPIEPGFPSPAVRAAAAEQMERVLRWARSWHHLEGGELDEYARAQIYAYAGGASTALWNLGLISGQDQARLIGEIRTLLGE